MEIDSVIDDNSNELPPTDVCYGMLEGIPLITIAEAVVLDSTKLVYGCFRDDGTVHRFSDQLPVGKLDEVALECLSKISNEQSIHIQFMMRNSNDSLKRKRRAASRKTQIAGRASVILYGPADVAEDIGDFLDRCGYCLQDPYGCDRDVPYKNPHCISSLFDEPQLTSSLSCPSNAPSAPFSAIDSLLALQSTDEYLECNQPEDINTKLSRYQLQALWFFLMREDNRNADRIWQLELSPNHPPIHKNQITRIHSSLPPTAWSGGILADEMGLGKTLQMISLVAASKALESGKTSLANSGTLSSTLIILPPSLLTTWEKQLNEHVQKGRLSWTRHHGKRRLQLHKDCQCPDIVLTTYHTVQLDFKRHSSSASALFNYQWRRIILDEAHIIRNMKTSLFRAVCSLKAVSRWAVTGTPVQNGLQDLRALLNFLRFHPYSDPRELDDSIFSHLNGDEREEGLRRFKTLFQTILIRRPATTINLPQRQDLKRTIDFTVAELQWYKEVESSHMALDTLDSGNNSWLPAIQAINKLRLVCNLGLASQSTRSTEQSSWQKRSNGALSESSLAETRMINELYLGSTECVECKGVIFAPDGEGPGGCGALLYYSTCFKVLCPLCSMLNTAEGSPDCSCGPGVVCTLQPLMNREDMGMDETQTGALPSFGLSSKAQAVVDEVRNAGSEKHVVLSSWRTSLDMIRQGLDEAGIRHVRVDGTMGNDQRHAALERFRKDPNILVILLTISCGGVGLDLTVASRIHLVEPQWNPAMEHQAMARVHRIGQTKPVVTMRYVMRDSIEESVISCQEKKNQVAALLT